MGSLVATNKGGTFSLAPAGMHLGRVCQIIDLGTHNVVFQGKHQGVARKVRIAFELPTKKHVFNPDKGEEPYVMSNEYTLSTHEKATFRKHMESWKGSVMTPEQVAGFDVIKLMGKIAMVSIIHKAKTDGSKIAKIAGIGPIPDEMKNQVPGAILPTVLYTIDMGRNEVFKTLPQWIQEKIMQSHEMSQQPQQQATAPQSDAPTDESNPF